MLIKNGFILASIFLILIIGVAGYYKRAKTPEAVPVPSESTVAEASTIKGTLGELLAGGKNLKCDIAKDGHPVGYETAYISGNKIYVEFKLSDTTVGEYTGYFIQDGNKGYYWTSKDSRGTSFPVDEPLKFGDEIDKAKGDTSLNLDEEVDLKCTKWAVDNSKFIPPQNIQFVDFQQALQGKINDTKKNVCASIKDDLARTACFQYSGITN